MTKRNQPPAQLPEDPQVPDHVARVASMRDAAAVDVERLFAEIADLKKQLALSEDQRSEAEAAALAAAEAQGMLMQRQIEEVATGKTVKVKRGDGFTVVGHKDDGRDILRPKWKEVRLPTYFYKIDLPPCGGFELQTNGVSLYHGTVYEFDVDTLRSVKERVGRLWEHDRNIHGVNENAYRRQQSPVLSARG